jgi:uncharacterized GH25 family protein
MRGVRVAAFLAGAVCCSAVAAAAGDGTVRGKVSFREKPLAGATVHLFADWKGGFQGASAAQARTGEDGSFEASAPAGRYFVVVKKTASGGDGPLAAGDLYAFYGGNPVAVSAGEPIVIGVNASTVIGVDAPAAAGGTGIRGRVFLDGAPLDRARVTLYQDGETIFRGMGYASGLTTADGSFSFNLEPGSYWVVARKRTGDDKMGPLNAGDLFAFAHANPVTVAAGAFTVITLNAAAKQVKVKDAGQEITLDGTVKGGETFVRGVVKDPKGKPVKGVYVGAYRDSMMIYKPDFISAATGEDGAYTLTLGAGGEYFIIARNTLGGPAERGDLLGRYAGNEDHSLVVKAGDKLTGVDIVVEPVE